ALETRTAARLVEATKVYGRGESAVTALDRVSVAFGEAMFTAVMGPSGSGKSTLLHCLAGLDKLTSGRALLGDTDLAPLGDGRLTELRRARVGFVFQSYNLLPTLTTLENITLPSDLAGVPVDRQWLATGIDIVG